MKNLSFKLLGCCMLISSGFAYADDECTPTYDTNKETLNMPCLKIIDSEANEAYIDELEMNVTTDGDEFILYPVEKIDNETSERKPRWTSGYYRLQSGGGKCLAPENTNNGARVTTQNCRQYKAKQLWQKSSNGELKNFYGKCLDVRGGQIDGNGSVVQIWDCNGSTQQSWIRWGSNIRPTGSMWTHCLDIHAPDLYNSGAKVQIWSCNQTLPQVFNWVKG